MADETHDEPRGEAQGADGARQANPPYVALRLRTGEEETRHVDGLVIGRAPNGNGIVEHARDRFIVTPASLAAIGAVMYGDGSPLAGKASFAQLHEVHAYVDRAIYRACAAAELPPPPDGEPGPLWLVLHLIEERAQLLAGVSYRQRVVDDLRAILARERSEWDDTRKAGQVQAARLREHNEKLRERVRELEQLRDAAEAALADARAWVSGSDERSRAEPPAPRRGRVVGESCAADGVARVHGPMGVDAAETLYEVLAATYRSRSPRVMYSVELRVEGAPGYIRRASWHGEGA